MQIREIQEVIVIGDNVYWVFSTFQVVAPFPEGLNNRQQLLVIDLVVPFRIIERL